MFSLPFIFGFTPVIYRGVIAGVDWAADDHKNAGPTKKSVAK